MAHDRGLVEDDALAAHVDQRVGGAQVDGEIGGEIAAQEGEHEGLSLCQAAVATRRGRVSARPVARACDRTR
jgi:hypothetical protein